MGLDIDPAAVCASEQNAQLNGVAGRCSFYLCGVDSPDSGQGDVFVPGDHVFDLCVANIFQKDLINLRDHICGLVRPGGTVVMSGLLKNQVRSFRSMIKPHIVSTRAWLPQSAVYDVVCRLTMSLQRTHKWPNLPVQQS